MTYKQLKDEVRNQLFPSGEAENLVEIHDGFFLQAMYDLQFFVPCFKANQKTLFPHCATYFECGMTVLPQPAAQVSSVYVIDRINPDTGLEDATVDLEWCAKVFYDEVQFCHINRYVQLCEKTGSTIESVTDAFASLLFGVYRRKRFYPRPTDEGLAGLPKLPEGFHYPQASTDAAGRSSGGVYARSNGRLYIAPWIQATETAVVVSNGIKKVFNDADIIEDNPKLKQAVRLHVGHQHESAYGDPAKAREFYEQLWDKSLGVMEALRVECVDQSRSIGCNEQTSGMARGLAGLESGNVFYNDTRSEYTASCPAGKTGSPVKVIKEIGSVPSAISVADANARAMQQATDEAKTQLVCVDVPVTYYSDPQVGHASCPGPQSDGTPAAEGSEVNVPVPAGYKTSPDSKEAANALAKSAADALAAAQLVCTYWNKAQTATVSCPTGEVGDDVTKTQAAHTYSGPSQDVADGLAHNEAERLARLELVCDAIPAPVVYSQAQTAGPFTKVCTGNAARPGGGYDACFYTITLTVNISAGKASGGTQDEANQKALAIASSYAFAVMNAAYFCASFPACRDGARTYNI